ncbi:MAG: hypothetical protein ACPG4X_19910 [Pikeienuella sp.]
MQIPTVKITVDGRQKIVNADDPRVSSVPASPDDIDGLKKAELVELLEAHGADTGGTVPKLKTRLKAVMFLGA